MLTDVVIANKSYIKTEVEDEAMLDRIAVNVIRNDCPDFLLPMRIVDINGEPEIRYEMLPGIRMEYMNSEMSKSEFVSLLRKLLEPFATCGDWFLDYHYIVLDKKYIIVDQQNHKVRYLYLPIADKANTDEKILKFFETLIITTSIPDGKDYTIELMRAINSPGATLTSLLNIMGADKEPSRSVSASAPVYPVQQPPVQPAPAPTPAPAPAPTPAPAPAPAKKEEKKSFSGSASLAGKDNGFAAGLAGSSFASNLFGDSSEEDPKSSAKDKNKDKEKNKEKKGSLFGGLLGKKNAEDNQKGSATMGSAPVRPAPAPAPVPPKPAFNPYMDSGDTVTLDDDYSSNASPDSLELRLVNGAGFACPQTITLDLSKGVATVGRCDKTGAPQADFNFDMSMTFVGRRHFRVERHGDKYVIIDLQSKNKTFLNGEELIPNVEYPLNHGDKIGICLKNQITYQVR